MRYTRADLQSCDSGQSVKDDAGFTHLPTGCDTEFLTDRFGQVFDDMHFETQLLRVESGLLDAMRFGQSDHIDPCDARGLQPVGECPARGHGGGDFLTGGNAVGVVLKAFEAGI